jgi:hypothetical protein
LEESGLNLSFLLKRALKFHRIKDERIIQLVFTVNLVLSVLPVFIRLDIFNGFLLVFLSFIILTYLNNMYLLANLYEFKRTTYNFKTCFVVVRLKYFKLLLCGIIINLFFVFGLPLIIPALIFYFMFLFLNIIILDKDIKIDKAIAESIKMTNGRKKEYFIAFLAIAAIGFFLYIALFTVSSIFIGGKAVYIFYFIFTLIKLVYQRLIALLYINMQRVKKLKKQ